MYIVSIQMKTKITFWILTITVFIGLLLPALVQDGMFLDGITYSAISKNMANGFGTFWNPHYTKTLYASFYEHPPFVFIIQSFFFKVFGDGIYTERIYSLLTAILTSTGIVLSWRLFNRNNDLKDYSWILILLWISIPIIPWSYKNNILENTVGVFTIFSVYFISKSLIENRIVYLLLGSLFIVMAFLSKGFVGLFPVVVPLIFGIVFKFKKQRKAILFGIYLMVLSISLFYLLFALFPESKSNIMAYFEQQLLPALANQREVTTNNRFSIMIDLIIELTVPIVLLIYITIYNWRKTRDLKLLNSKESLFFLLVAISASLPLMVSLKQGKFYLAPSIPFYILSIGFLIIPYFKVIIEKWSNTTLLWIKRISYLTLSFIILFSVLRFGKYSRDEEKLKDVYVITQFIPEGTIIGTSRALYEDWTLDAYLSRIGYLSLDRDHQHDFLLLEKNNAIEAQILEEYEEMDLSLIKYKVFTKKNTLED